MQSELAGLIRESAIIIWDEASMANKVLFECLDRTLRDATGVHRAFGGKPILLGGDFRQVRHKSK